VLCGRERLPNAEVALNPNARQTEPSTLAEPAAAEAAPQDRASLLARLFREHNRELVGFLCTRLRSEQDAREVAQEAYARLLRLDQPDTVSLLRAYLFKTAANLAVDRLRHRSTCRNAEPKLALWDEQAEEPTPEQLAMRREEVQLVGEYLDELPERHRQAFILYRVHDLGIEEVAARLGVTDRMVRNYIVKVMTHCCVRLDSRDARPRGRR